MNTILTITGSDGTGGSGVQADIQLISALGGAAASAITSITVQNTLGIQEFHDLPASVVRQQVEAIINDQPFVAESVVVDRASHIVALVYFAQDAMKKAGLAAETIADLPERVRVNSNKKLANYSQISKVEVQEMPFEKTPKMSIKRFLYK